MIHLPSLLYRLGLSRAEELHAIPNFVVLVVPHVPYGRFPRLLQFFSASIIAMTAMSFDVMGMIS
ncbi:MAG: hypothetical protein M3Z35_11190, partial [Nitrospirota bacterium]|nr:hypothetical protein [Nitrospirota bacterium]